MNDRPERNKFEAAVPSYAGSVVWVTGASSGIGRELAQLLAALKAYVIITARNAEALEEVVAACGGDHKVRALPADLEDTESLPDLVHAAEQLFGPIDAVFHAAGISQRALAEETSPAVMRRIMAVNYHAPAVITSLLLPGMIERDSGTIVLISSLAARIPTPLRSSYTASKAALHGFLDCLRLELGRSNVHLLMAVPGFVRTEISRNALTGGGDLHGKMDDSQARGMDANKCARKIVQALLSGKEEVEIGFGFQGRLGLFLKAIAPGVLARRFRRQARKARADTQHS